MSEPKCFTDLRTLVAELHPLLFAVLEQLSVLGQGDAQVVRPAHPWELPPAQDQGSQLLWCCASFSNDIDGFAFALRLIRICTRDGHAVAGDADSCGLMRICGCDAEDKICMRIVGKKNKVKNRTKLAQNGSKYDKNGLNS